MFYVQSGKAPHTGGNMRKIMGEISLVGKSSRVNRKDGGGQRLRPFGKCS